MADDAATQSPPVQTVPSDRGMAILSFIGQSCNYAAKDNLRALMQSVLERFTACWSHSVQGKESEEVKFYNNLIAILLALHCAIIETAQAIHAMQASEGSRGRSPSVEAMVGPGLSLPDSIHARLLEKFTQGSLAHILQLRRNVLNHLVSRLYASFCRRDLQDDERYYATIGLGLLWLDKYSPYDDRLNTAGGDHLNELQKREVKNATRRKTLWQVLESTEFMFLRAQRNRSDSSASFYSAYDNLNGRIAFQDQHINSLGPLLDVRLPMPHSPRASHQGESRGESAQSCGAQQLPDEHVAMDPVKLSNAGIVYLKTLLPIHVTERIMRYLHSDVANGPAHCKYYLTQQLGLVFGAYVEAHLRDNPAWTYKPNDIMIVSLCDILAYMDTKFASGELQSIERFNESLRRSLRNADLSTVGRVKACMSTAIQDFIRRDAKGRFSDGDEHSLAAKLCHWADVNYRPVPQGFLGTLLGRIPEGVESATNAVSRVWSNGRIPVADLETRNSTPGLMRALNKHRQDTPPREKSFAEFERGEREALLARAQCVAAEERRRSDPGSDSEHHPNANGVSVEMSPLRPR